MLQTKYDLNAEVLVSGKIENVEIYEELVECNSPNCHYQTFIDYVLKTKEGSELIVHEEDIITAPGRKEVKIKDFSNEEILNEAHNRGLIALA